MSVDFTAIGQALAARFSAAAMTAPAGYRAVRVSTDQLPNQLPPTPCVLVFPAAGTFDSVNSSRLATTEFTVQFYFDQSGDLTRTQAGLLKWLAVLTDQLRGALKLGGIVDRATVDSWTIGILNYAGVDYSGIELRVGVTTSEGWSATA